MHRLPDAAGDPRELPELLQRPLKRAIARGDVDPDTNLNLVADVALPVILHRAMWDERFLDSLLDEVLMRLVRPMWADPPVPSLDVS